LNKIYPEIEELIPHRKPILCVDKVISVDGLTAETRYKIDESCIFFSDGFFSEMGLLENAAQTSFVFLKFFFADTQDDLWGAGKDSVGFISHITELKTCFLPESADELFTVTSTELVFDTENLKICNVKAEISVRSEIAFTTEMKMILQTREL